MVTYCSKASVVQTNVKVQTFPCVRLCSCVCVCVCVCVGACVRACMQVYVRANLGKAGAQGFMKPCKASFVYAVDLCRVPCQSIAIAHSCTRPSLCLLAFLCLVRWHPRHLSRCPRGSGPIGYARRAPARQVPWHGRMKGRALQRPWE